jgi:hypothetical protein
VGEEVQICHRCRNPLLWLEVVGVKWIMAEDPFYWHYRCPNRGGALTRIEMIKVSDEKAEEFKSGRVMPMKFPCRFCGKEHDGYLERSKFGKS